MQDLQASGLNPWILLIVSVGTSTTIGGIINAYLSRRKTKAEVGETVARTGKTAAEITEVGASTADTQVDTSLKLMAEMRSDMALMREELNQTRKDAAVARAEAAQIRLEFDDTLAELAALQRWKRAHTALMAQHAIWDAQVVKVVRELGGRIDPPPPLSPHPEDYDHSADA